MQNQSESEFLTEVGKRLAFFRKQRGLSQEHVALNAGITQCYLSDAERGKRNISLKVLYSLARVLSVEPIQLLDFRSVYISESLRGDIEINVANIKNEAP
jgi:transcriptional regulator with XRE-family HTH domain